MIDFSPVMSLALLLVRPGMLVMVAPGFGGAYTPPHLKIGLTVIIAVGLLPVVRMPAIGSDIALAGTVAREVAIGLSLALVTRALMAAAEFAGHMSGFQIGFSYGATINPANGARDTVVASLYGMLALLTFLGINGHHLLLQALAWSYASMPIGLGEVHGSLGSAVPRVFALIFTVALRLAAPVVLVLLLVELGIGLISRTAPSLSTMVIGYPLRIMIGLTVLAAAVAGVPQLIAAVTERTLTLAAEVASAFR